MPPLRLTLVLALTSVLSLFQTGYYLSVVNNTGDILQNFTNYSFQSHYGYFLNKQQCSTMWSFIVALYTVGGIFGSWSTMWLVERLGRKITIMVLNNIIGVGACLMAGFSGLANSFELLAGSRFLIGFNAGLATGAMGLYLTECSPVEFRGFFGSFLNTAITFFTLFSTVLSLSNIMGTQNLWPYLFGFGFIPAVIQILLTPLFPDSPKYLLMTKMDEVRARKSVLYYYGMEANVEKVFEEFRREEKYADQQVGLIQALRDPHFRFPIVLSSIINVAVISTGVIAIFSYSSQIFYLVGFPPDKSQLITTTMITFTMVGAIAGLYLIEIWGRRPLLLYGTLTCLVCDILFMFLNFACQMTGQIWLGYICAIILVIHVTVFTASGGPIAWFISSELMPQSARSVGASVSVTVNWIMALVTSFVFAPLNEAVQVWSFLLFIIPLIPCLIYMWIKMPETKNRHIDEIMSHWINPTTKPKT